ncbi:ribonuclease H-like domain-containing protein [Haematococcus lacustris]
MDCEMVGVGPDGLRSALARVAVVNSEGHVLLDRFVRPKERVVDYRTQYSGVRPADLHGPQVLELEAAQAQVAALLKGRMLVGHGLQNDLKALLLDHPRKDMRDTARYPPLMRRLGPGRKAKPRALRHLAAELLGLDIQSGEHSPVDDARAALYLYLRLRQEWEAFIKSGGLRKNAKDLKSARAAATTAATIAATAGPRAVPGTRHGRGEAKSEDVLTPAQRRALRRGRGIKAAFGGSAVRSGPPSRVGGSVALEPVEMAELIASAANASSHGTGLHAQQSAVRMAQVMQRHVRDDPMADI